MSFHYLALFVLGMLFGLPAGPALADKEISLAVVPQLTPTVTHKNWKPFADRLGRDTGLRIRVQVFRTFDEFETALVNGHADLAYMNPYHQIMARKAQGYIPLVRDGGLNLSGVLVVPVTSPIRSVRELHNKEIGFPDPNAFAASLYLRALLREREKISFKPRYFTTHGNVYRHVIVGTVAAGGGVNRTLSQDRPETRAALRVLYETPPSPSHPLSAHPRVPAAVRESLIKAIQDMATQEAGRALLKVVQFNKPVRADFARDYESLARLNIDRYSVATKLPAP
jgi:phosphonate transport system substrate-binding protein